MNPADLNIETYMALAYTRVHMFPRFLGAAMRTRARGGRLRERVPDRE